MSPPSPPIAVLIADDQALVRDGFTRIVDSQPDMHVVGTAADGAAAIRCVRELQPDVVLMDIRMPGLDGIEATHAIISQQISPTTRILGLTTYDTDDYAVRILKAGAVGFLLKDSTAVQLVNAIRGAYGGTFTTSASTTLRLLDRIVVDYADGRSTNDSVLVALTDRERAVFEWVIAGHSNPEIARELHIAEVTVKTHVGHILAKFHVRDRVHLVIWAHRNGLAQFRDVAIGAVEGASN